MSCPFDNGQPATSLPPLAHSEAEIDPGGLWGSGGGSILGVPEVPRGRWPLSSEEPLLTTGSGQRAYTIATRERCQDAARRHFLHSGPPRCPQRFMLSGSQPALAPPPKTVPHPMLQSQGWVSHPPPSPIFFQCILPSPYLHSLRPGPCHPGLGAAGMAPPVYPPPSRGISVNHTDNRGFLCSTLSMENRK